MRLTSLPRAFAQRAEHLEPGLDICHPERRRQQRLLRPEPGDGPRGGTTDQQPLSRPPSVERGHVGMGVNVCITLSQ